MTEKILAFVGIALGFYFIARYAVLKLIVEPAITKASAKIAKDAFQRDQKKVAEEFDRMNQEIKDAKLHYDRAKRAAAHDPKDLSSR